MGTFVRAYCVNGNTFDLFRHTVEQNSYQLVDARGAVIAAELSQVPTDEEVAAIVEEPRAA